MDILNKILWLVTTIVLVSSGIYYTIKLNFLHLNFKKIFWSLKKNDENSDGISSFSSLNIALGSCIGVGSLAGIALSIYKGGLGTIFWICLSCILVAPNSLVENTLAVIFHQKSKNGYSGGPSYYIKKGLGCKKLATIYAVLIIVTYVLGFLTIQSNTIAVSFSSVFNIPKIVIGIFVGLISFLIILKGVKIIGKISSILIPLMGIIYLMISLFIVIKNINLIPSLLIEIIKSAFNFKAFGFGVISTMLIGIQRGIFSNESGSGTAAIASGTSSTNVAINQGLISTLGVYFTTFIICTSTALIILTSNYNPLNYVDVNGIEITQDALNYHLGTFGNIVLYFCIISFAFSTIISGYYYGESNFKYLFKNAGDFSILILKIVTCFLLILGSFLSPTIIWNFVDILLAIITIINIFAIFSLRNNMINEYNDFKRKCNDDRK